MATTVPGFTELERLALEVAHAAAASVRASSDTEPLGTKSTATDIVTRTDLSTERMVRELLAAATPGARVLGEERGSGTLGEGPMGTIEWVIDPLDGTVNFSYGVPISAVSIAAVVAGRTVAAAIVDIYRGEGFAAHRGGGARLDGTDISCRNTTDLSQSLVATGFSYSPTIRRRHGRTIADLLGDVRDVRAFGSAALNLCWVGAGRLDAYVERDIKPWDYAAGSLIAGEAGAQIELPCPENDRLVLAAPPGIFEAIRSRI